MPAPERLYDACAAALAAIQAGYTAQGVALPDRQLVTPGLPAWDCDVLAVTAERTFSYSDSLTAELADPQVAAIGHRLRGAVLALWMVRCVPTITADGGVVKPPDPADEQAAARVILSDADRMMDALHRAERAGQLGGCSGLSFDSWLSVPPAGGLGGGVLRVRVGLA